MKKNNSHLRVVWDKDAEQHIDNGVNESIQLSFSFYEEEQEVAFLDDLSLSRVLFRNTLEALQPHYLFDLRSCPRFDFFGYSRKKAFSDFERCNAQYFCLTSEEIADDVAQRIKVIVSKIHQTSNGISGPLVILMETSDLFDEAFELLPKPDTPSGKWRVSQATP